MLPCGEYDVSDAQAQLLHDIVDEGRFQDNMDGKIYITLLPTTPILRVHFLTVWCSIIMHLNHASVASLLQLSLKQLFKLSGCVGQAIVGIFHSYYDDYKRFSSQMFDHTRHRVHNGIANTTHWMSQPLISPPMQSSTSQHIHRQIIILI